MNFQLLSRSNRSWYCLGLSTIVLIPLLAGFTQKSAMGEQATGEQESDAQVTRQATAPITDQQVSHEQMSPEQVTHRPVALRGSAFASFVNPSAINNLPLTESQLSSSQTRNELPSTQQIALTSQEQSVLRQGQVLFSGKQGNYTARVMANASTDTAWAVLTDYNNFARFLPGVESSQLLTSSGSQKQFEQVNVIRIFPFTHRERVVIAASESYPDKIAFNLVDGDLEKLQGVWYVTGAGNQVMVTHQVSVHPSGSNRSLFYTIYEDNLRKTMAALKQEIERRSQQ